MMRSHQRDRLPPPTISTAHRKKGLEMEEDKSCRVIKEIRHAGAHL
ncbi:hypothetical protein GXM_06403 [Nostoc sphaeroides CCNUC1]|uniref:Uncharacterized protein n=1 Tax=Nostoc sphaeroides CCNUC1 TaxID=2653204 RepID=A0A5P8WAI2_9NOSO|nr:hypothetical protein GXM_06403 [Nostoc sphaeroides CCNUC1]